MRRVGLRDRFEVIDAWVGPGSIPALFPSACASERLGSRQAPVENTNLELVIAIEVLHASKESVVALR